MADVNEGSVAVLLAVILTALSSCVLILRFVSLVITARRAGLDDISVITAGISSIALTCFIYGQQQYGLGRDADEVTPRDSESMLKYLWFTVMAYGSGMTFLKISALLSYLRFLVHEPTRILCWTLISACSLFGVAGLFTNIFACRPLSYSWDKNIPGGKCINQVAWWYSAAAWTIVTDIVVVAIPIAAFKSLTMPRVQKMALIAVFALGGFGCITSILRLHSLHAAATSTNFTRDNAVAARWSSVELNVGIVCMSLPFLKPVLVATIPSSLVSKKRLNRSSGTVVGSRSQFPESRQSSETTKTSVPDPWSVS